MQVKRNNFRKGQHVNNIILCKTGQIKKEDTEELQSLMNVLLIFVVRNIKLIKIHIQGLTPYK